MREGWIKSRLGDLGKITSSKRIFKREYTDVGIPFYRTKEVKERAHGRSISTELFISEARYNEIKKKHGIPQKGDILLTAIGTIGETFVVDGKEDFYFKDGNVLWLKDFKAVNPYFLRYVLMSFLEQLKKLSHGSAYNALPIEKLKNYIVCLPSVKEQKCIVAILDEAFAGIDTAIANTEKNLANARELFESYLNSVFTRGGEGWGNLKLKDVTTKITDGVHKKPHYVDNGVPFIKINNLTAGLGISFEGVSYISREDHELFCKRTNPEKGDILITKDGTIGIVRIIDTDVEFSIFVSVALIKPIDKSISPYLKYVLESPLIQNQINPQGAALKHLYLRDLREFLVPLPPKEVQDRIVERLDSFSAESYRLESIYQQKLNSLNELKQSLLQKAFSGDLTAEEEEIADKAVA